MKRAALDFQKNQGLFFILLSLLITENTTRREIMRIVLL